MSLHNSRNSRNSRETLRLEMSLVLLTLVLISLLIAAVDANEADGEVVEGIFSIRVTNDFKILPSTIHGRGVFTTRPYAIGESVGAQWYSTKEESIWDPPYCNFNKELRSNMSDTELALCPWRSTNHQCKDATFELCTCPWLRGKLFIAVARVPVPVGAEITFNFLAAREHIEIKGFTHDCTLPHELEPAKQCTQCSQYYKPKKSKHQEHRERGSREL